MDDNLLDPLARLFESLADPTSVAILGDAVVDEIDYRLLCSERVCALSNYIAPFPLDSLVDAYTSNRSRIDVLWLSVLIVHPA